MKKGGVIHDDSRIKDIYRNIKSVAIIGLSSNPAKDSHKVGEYLQKQGYKIYPVHPKADRILGEKAFKSLDDLTAELKEPVDVVDVFRKPEQIVPHAEEAVRHGPKIFWMQLGIENENAAQILTDAGIDVVMNHCMKQEHEKYFN